MRRKIYILGLGLLCMVLASCASKPGDESVTKGAKKPAVSAADDHSGPPRGVIDAIEGDPVVGGPISVRGWAAPTNGVPLKKVEVVLDGTVVAQASTGLPRPDVVNVFHRQDWLNSGWKAEIYLNNVRPGQHRVDVVAYDSRNLKTILDGAKMISIKAADQKSPT